MTYPPTHSFSVYAQLSIPQARLRQDLYLEQVLYEVCLYLVTLTVHVAEFPALSLIVYDLFEIKRLKSILLFFAPLPPVSETLI